MKAYFFNRTKTKEVFYIPKNLIVIQQNQEFIIDYYANNLKAFDSIWRSEDSPERRRIFGCLTNCVVSELEISKEFVQEFQDYCWEETPMNIVRANICALSMYDAAKKSIEQFRKK